MQEQGIWSSLAEWRLASVPGNQFLAAELVASAVEPLRLTRKQLADLEIVVVEATLNAIEHGNHFQPESLVLLQVFSHTTALLVRVRDQGTSGPISEPALPDLEAKLAGRQAARGWGFFLMRQLADAVYLSSDSHSHTVEIVLSLHSERKSCSPGAKP